MIEPPPAEASPETRPAAVILDALAAPADPSLDALLGGEGAGRLREALRARARQWAGAVAPGKVLEAASLAAALDTLREHAGPLLIAAPDVPGLDERIARVALDDLAAGCDVALGAAHDARPYIVAVPRPDPGLLRFVEATFTDGVLGAFESRGVVVGMLRSQRRLASAADARAKALDPLTPVELVKLLAAAGAHGG